MDIEPGATGAPTVEKNMLPATRKLDFSEVPVIDMSPERFATPESRKRLADELAEACATVGFLYLKNHPIPQAQIDGVFEAVKAFFALPQEAKDAVSMAKNRHFQGYLPMLTKGTGNAERGGTITANKQEAFQFRRPLAADDPDLLTGERLAGTIPWPRELPALKEVLLAYHARMCRFGESMIELFELGLDLPRDAIRQHFRKDMNALRIIHYPPQQVDESGANLGTRAHTDTDAFTFVYQDATGGLEIRNRDGEWIGVPPIPGTYVLNIGEVMKVWTDGVFSSTPHRVINRYGKERYSVPFFMFPTYDEVIAPKIRNPDPSNVAPEDFHTSMPRDKPFVWGEFKKANYARINPTAPERAMAD
ncbi:isopenicillin N synthase-like dioxygenase [Pigmentiphaga kullae]|uniref:2-oxoglutarate-dependent ethylene/succinate-forming enzyme n=2 Tax=Pigmentiphaga kullae TaxID=151784 RepID=A0A4Q7NFT4_9BURK|nr:isopenicillin N synthase-like dioxygenase [Pigmentiphaga kullae]